MIGAASVFRGLAALRNAGTMPDCVESRRRLALTRIDPSVRQEQHFLQMAAGLVSSRPLLMSNCAPDRLRRLSVDADKCPSHVFRVTEPDRLRDAFDRFHSRLYPASG